MQINQKWGILKEVQEQGPPMNTEILDKAAEALEDLTDDERVEYLEGITARWDDQPSVDYMAKALLGT